MAEGTIQIALKAIDKYSGVITGLNQGFELIGKSISAVGKISDVAFGTIKTGLDLAVQGGAFKEISSQFNIMAKSLRYNGQSIINTLDEITQNTMSLPAMFALAGKGMTAGLDEPDLEKIFTFIKKRTELTGESFEAMAEMVFKAIETGKYAPLTSMGLLIEKGDRLGAVLKEMERVTDYYGEASFNAGDKIAALSEQQNRFTIALGTAINDSPKFQQILTKITAAAIDFVRSFDPAPVSAFIDFLLGGMESLFRLIARSFPEMGKTFDGFFKDGKVNGRAFTLSILNMFFEILKTAGQTINGIVEFLRKSNFSIQTTRILNGVVQAFVFSGKLIQESIIDVFSFALQGVRYFLDDLAKLAAEHPDIAEMIGVSPGELQLLEQNLGKVNRSLISGSESLSHGLDKIGKKSELALSDIGGALKGWKLDLSGVESAQKAVNEAITKVDYAKPAASAVKAFEAVKSKIGSTMADAIKGGGKKGKEALTAELKSVEELIAHIRSKGGSWSSLSGLKADADAIRKKLAEINGEAKEINEETGTALTIKTEGKTGLRAEIDAYLSSANWPAEFQALGQFLLGFVIAKARGEKLPLILTTVPA